MDKIKSITRGQAILFGLIVLLCLGVFIGIKVVNNNSIDNYHNFEKQLKISAKNYIKLNNVVIQKDGEKRITLKQLKSQDLVPTDTNLKDKCTGYVYVLNQLDIESNKYKKIYYSYIKCGSKYKTAGYVNY